MALRARQDRSRSAPSSDTGLHRQAGNTGADRHEPEDLPAGARRTPFASFSWSPCRVHRHVELYGFGQLVYPVSALALSIRGPCSSRQALAGVGTPVLNFPIRPPPLLLATSTGENQEACSLLAACVGLLLAGTARAFNLDAVGGDPPTPSATVGGADDDWLPG